jgi:hypothetical protein
MIEHRDTLVIFVKAVPRWGSWQVVHVSEYSGKKPDWDEWSHKLLVRAYVKVLHEQMVNEKIPEFPTYAEFGAEE